MLTTPDESALNGVALVELVQRSGGADTLYQFGVLAGLQCEHVAVALYLANANVKIAGVTKFDLEAFLGEQRSQALAADEPPPPGGMA
jgi:hypothetical protein